MDARRLAGDLSRFPWRSTALTLYERFREDRLGLSASSLTFTTTIALVPFFAVVLSIFTAFPMFAKLQATLQAWLVQSLVPESIARQVLGYLTQFAGKASRLGAAGFAALMVTALALVLTIDRTLNGIWRVRRPRPLSQRILIYWAVMTLGPVLLAASLSITSYVISASRGLVGAMPGAVQVALDLVQFALLACALTAVYRYVPNVPVRPAHAWAGGLFGAAGIELAKRMLAWYIASVPTYSLVYGAFATLPILLVWIYMAWVIVLLGAVIAAYLPSLLAGASRRVGGQGWQFQLALDVLRHLVEAAATPSRGLSAPQLLQRMDVDGLQLEPVLETLVELGWVGRLNEVADESATRFILLADPRSTLVAPLVRALLLADTPATEKLWASGHFGEVRLADVL
ncbi:MAG TPA: YihY family inner membrane protein [Ramlibacter sp.]|uniref:YihY family inner membrane protein n=1 Tax=Ramlibacter sp. TaxID=1917967 RepID=UPI002BE7AD15|nr:YihY family inner membrane protein [Ramlibacter sp.]HVZ44315.1 YihY family inner membrane protein [Ramlibacter sp.]